MAEHFFQELKEKISMNDNIEEVRDYLEAVRRSWSIVIAKIPKFVDLKKDPHLQNAYIVNLWYLGWYIKILGYIPKYTTVYTRDIYYRNN